MLFFSISCVHGRVACAGYGLAGLLFGLFLSLHLVAIARSPQDPPPGTSPFATSDLFSRVIANQKQSEAILDEYESTQRVERRKTGSDLDPLETKVFRVFPAGPAMNKMTLSVDGKPLSADSYRSDLERLEKYLLWVVENGAAQKEAYAKAERKRKERYDLIEATHHAFRFTFEGQEMRGDRTLLRYSMTPNPGYKPTSRNTTLFTKVRGTLWIDEQSSELAKVEGVVTEDVSLALFLAKVYKGSHFMQERYEIAPGIWEPTFEQYDFDGRKFLSSFSIHERTTYTNYKRVGPPKEAVDVVRAELNKIYAEQAAHGNSIR